MVSSGDLGQPKYASFFSVSATFICVPATAKTWRRFPASSAASEDQPSPKRRKRCRNNSGPSRLRETHSELPASRPSTQTLSVSATAKRALLRNKTRPMTSQSTTSGGNFRCPTFAPPRKAMASSMTSFESHWRSSSKLSVRS